MIGFDHFGLDLISKPIFFALMLVESCRIWYNMSIFYDREDQLYENEI